MRDELPDRDGTVDRDGITIAYRVHGHGDTAVLLLPAWAIADSRLWRAQVPFLSTRHRVITYDPRGNGASDRPVDPAAYDTFAQVGDALAVLDAAGVDRAVLVGNSFGGVLAYLLAALHPDRVAGAVMIGATLNVEGRDDFPLARGLLTFDHDHGRDEGWGRYNRHSFARDYAGFVRFFVAEALNDPHATKLREDAEEWGLATSPEVLAATLADRAGVPPAATGERLRALAPAISCPVLVIHGDQDRIAPVHLGRSLAALLDAPLVEMAGAGHCPQARYPVQVNRLLQRFLDGVDGVDGVDGGVGLDGLVGADADGGTGAGPVGPPGAKGPTDTGADGPSEAKGPADADADGPSEAKGPTDTGADGAADTLVAPAGRTLRRAPAPRVLYLSSPIGLGHARRDLAIVDELRRLAPGVEVDWLAQDPVTRVLDAAGERVHPASARLASESAHLESEAGEHDLHVFEAVRRMDQILVSNFMTFLDVLGSGRYDLVVGDEAWEVDHFLHEDPTVKGARFAWLTDFVGYLPVPAGGEREVLLAADLNAEMIGHVERHPGVRDAAIFVGDPDDVVPEAFGPGLPGIREWTEAHYRFSGYITGFDPAALPDRDALRDELGYGADETVVVAAVGGSGVGAHLLRRVIEAHPLVAGAVPGLRTVVVTGPRLDPAALPDAPGVDKRAYVPDLHRHLAACDLAVVQGGLTTTMELAATGRPFLYFPLRNHFEQQIHVRHRLERHGAGRPMDYAAATPESMADAITTELARPAVGAAVPAGGAARVAAVLADLL